MVFASAPKPSLSKLEMPSSEAVSEWWRLPSGRSPSSLESPRFWPPFRFFVFHAPPREGGQMDDWQTPPSPSSSLFTSPWRKSGEDIALQYSSYPRALQSDEPIDSFRSRRAGSLRDALSGLRPKWLRLSHARTDVDVSAICASVPELDEVDIVSPGTQFQAPGAK